MATITLTEDLYTLDLTVDSGDTLITAGYDVFCWGTVTLNGVLNAAGSLLTFKGDVQIADPTYLQNASRLVLDGYGDQVVNLNGATLSVSIVVGKPTGILYLTGSARTALFSAIPGSTIGFGAGREFFFDVLNLIGTGTQRIRLRSTSNGMAWLLRVTTVPTRTSYVDVRDSDARSGTTILADDGTNVDSGDNFNWYFGSAQDRRPSIEEIMEHRMGVLGVGNTYVGGNPLNWVELYQGELVETWSWEPSAETFRGRYYYNTTLNRLFKKVDGNVPFWRPISDDMSPQLGFTRVAASE